MRLLCTTEAADAAYVRCWMYDVRLENSRALRGIWALGGGEGGGGCAEFLQDEGRLNIYTALNAQMHDFFTSLFSQRVKT